MLDLYVDGDACPVKAEIYRVAERYGLKVFVVANNWMRVPDDPRIELVTVADGLGARAIGPSGKPFTEDSIGDVLATRNLMTELRETGEIQGGGRPFSKQDRSRFLQALDTVIQSIKRTGR